MQTAARRLASALSVLAIVGAARSAGATDLLSYTLSAPLKQPDCAGDGDGDCLNDAMENELAWIASPQYFLDDDESCASASYLGNGPLTGQFGRVDFVQVRPSAEAVMGGIPISRRVDIARWAPNAGVYTVNVVYVFGHFYDCHSAHLGDNENVVYSFGSSDLQNWSLFYSTYYAHGAANVFDGDYLATRAAEIGSPYASVAADQDGHGSWPGLSGGSDDCAGSQDDCGIFCVFTERNCFFDSTMASSFQNGHWDMIDTSRNVGEPESRWDPNVLRTSGAFASLTVSTVYGNNTELISSSPPVDAFCGFTCAQRDSSGHCLLPPGGAMLPPGTSIGPFGQLVVPNCSSSMYSKWDRNPITVNGVAP